MKNKRKKILLTGIIDSPYIKHMIEDVFIPLNYKVYYKSNNESFLNPINSKYFFEIGKFGKKRTFVNRCIRLLKRNFFFLVIKPFDFIIANYVTKDTIQESLKFKSKKTKILLYYWGSDLLRETKSDLQKLQIYFDNISYFLSDACNTKDAFIKNYGNKYPFEIIYFGDGVCDYIKEKLPDAIKDNKIRVAIGYNAREPQQHLAVIEQLNLQADKLQNYEFVFQMNYGRDDENYCALLENTLKQSNLNYSIMDKFLTEEELANFRLSIDIFINSQITDAFCSSIKEYFYAKTIILNASWLHYPELDLYNLNYIEYSKFEELPKLIINCNNLISKKQLDDNFIQLNNTLTWDSCKNNWNILLNKLSFGKY